MTVITGRTFRANQGKYIDMVHRGERVILSSRAGYVELKPIPKDDAERVKSTNSLSFTTVSSKEYKSFDTEEYVTLKSHEDIDKWFASL